VNFLLRYHQNPQVLKRRGIDKKREKNIEKEEKRGRKRKTPSVSSNKGKSIF
jgi:hypothetical protein